MTARSFSIAVTVPLTTWPSKLSRPPNVWSSIAAKSSRVGVAVVAIKDEFLILTLFRPTGCFRWSFGRTAAVAPCETRHPGGLDHAEGRDAGESEKGPRCQAPEGLPAASNGLAGRART